MSISRWDPWGEMVSLRDAMERLLAESVVRPRGGGASGGAATLALDVHEEGDDFVISAPAPGVSPDDVEITVRGDTVRIHGERRDQREEGGNEGQRWLMREQRFGSFERVIQLPSAVKAEAAHAEFKDGVLTVKLPKTEEAKERRIPVHGGQTGQPRDIPIEASASTGKPTETPEAKDADHRNVKAA